MPGARPPYDYIHIADGIVRDPVGRLLVVERSDGRWWIPGGRVERGETFAEAVVREVAEETGVVVRFDGIVALTEAITTDRHEVFVTCATRLLGGEPRPPADDPTILDVQWVTDEEASGLLPDYPVRGLILRAQLPHVPHFVEHDSET